MLRAEAILMIAFVALAIMTAAAIEDLSDATAERDQCVQLLNSKAGSIE